MTTGNLDLYKRNQIGRRKGGIITEGYKNYLFVILNIVDLFFSESIV